MQLLPGDEHFLGRALKLAQDAAGFASPNPTVGCVLARNGEVFGEGAHLYDNRDHAEIAALKDAAMRDHFARGATAYVTLEPCSHHGRTGPCADALVAAGIARCVIATVDPNPLVRREGITRLRAGGVETVLIDSGSQLAQDARRLNDAFAFAIQHGRPFVTLKAAVSREGYLAPLPAARPAVAPYWLTGAAARADVQRLRHCSDAILTGIGTVLADDPSLTDRSGLPRRRPLLRVVLDLQLRMPLGLKMLDGVNGDLLMIAGPHAADEVESDLRARGAEIVRVPPSQIGAGVDLDAVMQVLQEKQIRSVFIEAGAAVNGSFLRAGLVDRAVLYFSETALSAGGVPFASDGTSPSLLEAKLTSKRSSLFANEENSGAYDTRISGYLHDPWRHIA